MTDDRLAEIEQRLRRLEDERAIARMIASYGPLVDAGEADATARLWASDGTYDVEDLRMNGRAAVRDMVDSDGHQGLIGRGSAHFLGPAVVTVDDDDAVAVCESVLFVRRTDGYAALRAAANHFRLRRIDGRWQIMARTTHVLDGGATARGLLSAGVRGQDLTD